VAVTTQRVDPFQAATGEQAQLLKQLDPRRLPRHIAIIMDGNGRWAERRPGSAIVWADWLC